MRRGGWKVDRGLQSQIEDAAEKGIERVGWRG